MRHVAEVALRIGRVEINRRWDHLVPNGGQAGERLNGCRGAEQVARHALGGTDRNSIYMSAQNGLEGSCFSLVSHGRARGMGVDVIDLARLDSRVIEGRLNG